MKDDYKGSFLQFDITPNVSSNNPAYIQGMSGPQRVATEIGSPLFLQMFLMEDTNYTKTLFVSADIIGFDKSIVKYVRAHAAKWGIRPEGIVLNASHTHYAPGTISNMPISMGPYYENYTNQIMQIIVNNLLQLYVGLEPCQIHFAKANAKIGANRRKMINGKAVFAPNPSGEYMSDTPVIIIDLYKSNKRILWVNHACHPTGLGTDTRISSDFPGYMRQTLLKTRSADGVMFFQGAAGSSKETVPSEGSVEFCTNARHARKNGDMLAKQVLAAIGKNLHPIHGPLFCTCQLIHLPIKDASGNETLQAILQAPKKNLVLCEWAENMLKKYPTAEYPKTLPIEFQLIALGENFNILTVPAEPTAELASVIKSLYRVSGHDFILGYTNGLEGYLPTDKMIGDGGYEVKESHFVYQHPSALERGFEKKVLQSIDSCIDLKEKSGEPNGYGRYHLTTGEKRAFFVLSSGRCGTMTLARLLDLSPNAKVWHHPQPDPIKEALLAWWKDFDRRKSFWKLRSPVIYESWARGRIHGETDLLMTPFCDVIAEEIPNAKFIVLVRDPRDFVRSGMRRNYYKGHPWDFGRLRPKEGTTDYEDWNSMSQFEKVCWLWAATYSEIQERTKRINSRNIRILRFENLINDPLTLNDTFDYLGLEGFDEVQINTLMSKKLNKQMSGEFPKKDQWPEDYHRTLWKHCGALAESFGYRYKDFAKIKNQTKTTIWDFREYPHQIYPEKLKPEIILKGVKPNLKINKKTRIVSLGSCFARNIALELMRRKFNYIVTELPFSEFSAHWGQVFNTACIRQIFEYTFSDKWNPICRWWSKDGKVQDPFRRNILYDRETAADEFEKHKKASSLALKNTDIVILTLGLIETWRDKRDGMTYYRVPSPSVFDEKIHEFHVQPFEECVHDLNEVRKILADNNKDAKLIVSVSPVPLFATFRKDADVVSANTFSKATLRVAAEYFCRQHDNSFYFPSFEIVTQLLPNPWEADGRHVTVPAIVEIINTFIDYFSS